MIDFETDPMGFTIESIAATIPVEVFYNADHSEAILIHADGTYIISVASDGGVCSTYTSCEPVEEEDNQGWASGWTC